MTAYLLSHDRTLRPAVRGRARNVMHTGVSDTIPWCVQHSLRVCSQWPFTSDGVRCSGSDRSEDLMAVSVEGAESVVGRAPPRTHHRRPSPPRFPPLDPPRPRRAPPVQTRPSLLLTSFFFSFSFFLSLFRRVTRRPGSLASSFHEPAPPRARSPFSHLFPPSLRPSLPLITPFIPHPPPIAPHALLTPSHDHRLHAGRRVRLKADQQQRTRALWLWRSAASISSVARSEDPAPFSLGTDWRILDPEPRQLPLRDPSHAFDLRSHVASPDADLQSHVTSAVIS